MTTDPDRDTADVTAGLRALSQTYQDLPSPVADRLDRALAELPDLTAPDTAPPPVPPVRRPWWRRRYALASASLAVVAFVAGGLLFAVQPWSASMETGASGAQDQEQDKAEPFGEREHKDSAPSDDAGVHSEVEPYLVTYSNRDYRESDLTQARDVEEVGDMSAVPKSLVPLTSSPEARDHCVAQLNREFGGTTESVDFGRYEGEPAMIAIIADDAGGGVAVAVGGMCGISGTEVLGTAKF